MRAKPMCQKNEPRFGLQSRAANFGDLASDSPKPRGGPLKRDDALLWAFGARGSLANGMTGDQGCIDQDDVSGEMQAVSESL